MVGVEEEQRQHDDILGAEEHIFSVDAEWILAVEVVADHDAVHKGLHAWNMYFKDDCAKTDSKSGTLLDDLDDLRKLDSQSSPHYKVTECLAECLNRLVGATNFRHWMLKKS